jgi:hypothetical protein
VLRAIAATAFVVLAAALVILGRLGQADPSVRLRRILENAGYERVVVLTDRARGGPAGGDVDVTVEFDAAGEPSAAVAELADRAAGIAWKRARMDIANVTVRPKAAAGPRSFTAAQLRQDNGPPAADRERYGEMTGRARLVVLIAVIAVFAMFVLVLCAATAAVLVWKAGRRPPVSPAA